MDNNAKIELVEIKDIIPYENNPRFNDGAVEAVAKSIKEFGFKQPLVLDKNKVIIAGHTRLKASKELGLKRVPCIIADDLSAEQVQAYRLADNKTGELAEWDFELLSAELDELLDFDIDMEEFGFDSELLNTDDAEEIIIDDEFEIKPPVEPKAKLGDLYQLGRHRLLCGDSTDELEVELLMGGEKADMLLTDPPYNVSYEGKTKDALTIQNDEMANDDFREFLVNAFNTADMNMREGAVFYIWHADSEGYNFRGACNDVGWKVRQCLIWNKNSLVLGRQDYHWKHEPCLYGWKDGAGHLWNNDRSQTTVLEFDRPTKNLEHPTMKPVPLFDYLMKNNTKKGDKVLDLFGGSGTTIIAGEQNGRDAYVMELDPRYVDVIINRWETLTNEKAVLIRKGDGNDRKS